MKRVLIVDDEVSIADGLAALFQLADVEAEGAYDLESALARIESEYYPVILADVRMKTEAEGLALLEGIRRLSPRSRVASLTAYATPELEAQLREAGSTMVLRKPMEFDDIVAIIGELLNEIEATVDAGDIQDQLQLEQVYEDLNRMLLAIPQRRYGLSAEEAEDVVQEAWLLFLQKRQWIRSVKPWFAGTMMNLSRQKIDRLVRGRSHETELDEAVLERVTPAPSGPMETPLAMQQALSRLDERSRQLCTLIGMEGYSYDEVAAELGMPIGSVGPLYIRAKKRLRAVLEGVN